MKVWRMLNCVWKPGCAGRRLLAILIPASLAWLAIEWLLAPNGTVLIGPLLFVYYGFPQGWIAVAILLPSLFSYFVKPNGCTALVSLTALFVWLFLARLAGTIGC